MGIIHDNSGQNLNDYDYPSTPEYSVWQTENAESQVGMNTTGDSGTTSGSPDGNVKEVEIAKHNSGNWHHTLIVRPTRQFKIETNITNKGTQAAHDCEVKYYRSSDKLFSSDDHYYGDDDGVDIGVGDSETKHWPDSGEPYPTAPSSEGTWYIFSRIVCPDDENHGNDYSRNDDVEEYAVLKVIRPNFNFKRVALGASSFQYQGGENEVVSFSIHNEGAEPEQDVKVRYYVSAGSAYGNVIFWGEKNIPAIYIENKETFSTGFGFQVPTQTGLYTLSLHADGINAIDEGNEADNWHHLVFEVMAPAPPPPPPPGPNDYRHISPAALQSLFGD